jgi:hypothetical protein
MSFLHPNAVPPFLTEAVGRNVTVQRQADNKRNPSTKSTTLKIVGGAGTKPKQLRAGGLEPDESMTPGEYIANCKGAVVTTKGRNTIAVLEFHIIDGPHSGTAVRQWITIPDVDGHVPLGSRYARQCALATGHEIEPGDDLNPGSIFTSKTFRIDVGYRLTEKIGGTPTADNARYRKDAKDFLRCHRIIGLEEFLP